MTHSLRVEEVPRPTPPVSRTSIRLDDPRSVRSLRGMRRALASVKAEDGEAPVRFNSSI